MFAMLWVGNAISIILEHCGCRVLEYIDDDPNNVYACTYDTRLPSDGTQV